MDAVGFVLLGCGVVGELAGVAVVVAVAVAVAVAVGKECVNLVDVDISDRLDAEQNAMHPTDATFQRKGNIIRFAYDDRNRTLCVHIRSTALVVGCTQTVAFRRYLQNNGIVVPGIGKPTIVGKKRRRGKGVEK